MTDENGVDPAELIRSYGVLREAVTPLATLAKVSPTMLEEVIRLAMAMGIHAAERRAKQEEKIALVQGLMERATETLPFWRGQA